MQHSDPPPVEQTLPPPPDDYYQPHPKYYYNDGEPRPHYARRPPKKKSGNKTIAILIALLLILLALFMPIFNGQSLADRILDEMGQGGFPDYADIELERTLNVSVSGGQIDYAIDIPLPENIAASDGSPIQTVNEYTTSPTAAVIDKYGSQWMTWRGRTKHDFSVRVTYSIRSYTARWDLARDEVGTVSDIPANLDYLLDDEWLINPSLPSVSNLAHQLTAGMTNAYDMLEAIYDYMDAEYTYFTGDRSEPQTCSQTISSKAGDCDDQSILLCSLLRAVGIPAWLEFGVLYKPSTGGFGAHGWANVYIPLASGSGGSGTIDIVNDEFLVRDPLRFTEWESDGDADHLEDYYATMDYTYTAAAISINLDDGYSGIYSPSD